jgi:hypothetical protein
MLDTPQHYPRAGSQTDPSPAAEPNADGSTTVYFAPTQPARVKRGNRMQTDPKKAGSRSCAFYKHAPAVLRQDLQPREMELLK